MIASLFATRACVFSHLVFTVAFGLESWLLKAGHLDLEGQYIVNIVVFELTQMRGTKNVLVLCLILAAQGVLVARYFTSADWHWQIEAAIRCLLCAYELVVGAPARRLTF